MSGLWVNVCVVLTGEGDEEDDGDVDEQELEVSQVAEDLHNRGKHIQYYIISYFTVSLYICCMFIVCKMH